ncbi:LysR family transcriptional regulator, partial [Aeromonas media]
MNFTFRQIRYFVAVADSFSVSRAAAELHISQSAVTSAIRELETELGAALFERNPRGVTLTAQGHQFLLHARRILGAMTEAGQSLKAVAQQDQGQLTIGVTTLVAGYYLSEAIGRFRRAFPAVRIEVKEDEQPFLEHQIVNGEVDVGILMTNRTIRQEAFDTELLTRSPLRLWLAANHPLCAESTLSLKALGDEPMISLTADQLDQIIGAGLRRYGISPRTVLGPPPGGGGGGPVGRPPRGGPGGGVLVRAPARGAGRGGARGARPTPASSGSAWARANQG